MRPECCRGHFNIGGPAGLGPGRACEDIRVAFAFVVSEVGVVLFHPYRELAASVGEVPAHTDEAPQALLHKIIVHLMNLLTRRGGLVEEEGSTYLAGTNADSDDSRMPRPLQAAACNY